MLSVLVLFAPFFLDSYSRLHVQKLSRTLDRSLSIRSKPKGISSRFYLAGTEIEFQFLRRSYLSEQNVEQNR
jgi:hypothetical protein